MACTTARYFGMSHERLATQTNYAPMGVDLYNRQSLTPVTNESTTSARFGVKLTDDEAWLKTVISCLNPKRITYQ